MRYLSMAAACAAWLVLAGCQSIGSLDTSALQDAGGSAAKAFTVSDSDILSMSEQSCAAMDAKSQLAPTNSSYTARLNKLVLAMPQSINGKPADYKVYITKEVNAWAMANGCIRVYSGLLDLMNDDEMRGVIGHEIGHVALGHSKSQMRTAYGASAVRTAAGAAGGVVGMLTKSQAGDLAEKFVNAQFSQSQESAADNYAFDLLTERKLERSGLVTGFKKLAAQGGGGGIALLNSHPPSSQRAAAMQKRLDAARAAGGNRS